MRTGDAVLSGLALGEAFEVEARRAGFQLTTETRPNGETTARLDGQYLLIVTRPTLFGALSALMTLWAPWTQPPPPRPAEAPP